MAAPEENKNPPFSNKQEEDDYRFHEYIVNLLSVEEAVSIDELLGYVQDGATTNSVQPSPIANQEPSGLSGFDLNALPASRALPIARNEMPGFDLNAPPASTALPIAGNEMPSFTSLHLSGSQGNRLSRVATSMETNLGSSEIDVQAIEDFVQSAINILGEDFDQITLKGKMKVHKSDLTEEGGSSNSHLLVPEVIRSSDTSPQIEDDPNETLAPKSSKCYCREKGCDIELCSCSKGGVGCSKNCRCEGCGNIYGTKEESTAKTRI